MLCYCSIRPPQDKVIICYYSIVDEKINVIHNTIDNHKFVNQSFDSLKMLSNMFRSFARSRKFFLQIQYFSFDFTGKSFVKNILTILECFHNVKHGNNLLLHGSYDGMKNQLILAMSIILISMRRRWTNDFTISKPNEITPIRRAFICTLYIG